MKIGLLTHSVNPRGGVVHTLELATALHRLGHDVTVMAPATPGQTLFRAVPCHVALVPVEPAPADVREMVGQRIAAYRRTLDHTPELASFDVLHAQDGIGANALADLRDAGRIPGFVRTVHHLDDFGDPQLDHWQRRGCTEADLLLCVSDTWQAKLRDRLGLRAERVTNGVDAGRYGPMPDRHDARLRAELGLVGQGPVFLAVGGVEARKNTDRILEAFLAVHRSMPGARLLIAGGASLLNHDRYVQGFRARLDASGLDTGPRGPVRILGPMDDGVMPALFRLADAVLMPSLNEGFGLVVLEALASGTPVVVSYIAPFTEHLDASHVHWADPLDAASIADAMQAALRAPRGMRLRLRCAPLIERFSWAASADCHATLYARQLVRARTAEPA